MKLCLSVMIILWHHNTEDTILLWMVVLCVRTFETYFHSRDPNPFFWYLSLMMCTITLRRSLGTRKISQVTFGGPPWSRHRPQGGWLQPAMKIWKTLHDRLKSYIYVCLKSTQLLTQILATRVESQWIVAARPLYHLQYPVATKSSA